jgi:hypothetical protein
LKVISLPPLDFQQFIEVVVDEAVKLFLVSLKDDVVVDIAKDDVLAIFKVSNQFSHFSYLFLLEDLSLWEGHL